MKNRLTKMTACPTGGRSPGGRGKLRSQIALLVGVMFLAIVFLSVFYFSSFARIIFKNNYSYFDNNVNTNCAAVKTSLAQIEQHIKQYSTDTSVSSYWNSESPWNRSIHAQAITGSLRDMNMRMEAIDASVLCFLNGNLVPEDHVLPDTEFYTLLGEIFRAKASYAQFPLLCTMQNGAKRSQHLVLANRIEVFSNEKLARTGAAQMYVVIDMEKLLSAVSDSDIYSAIFLDNDSGRTLCAASPVDEYNGLVDAFLKHPMGNSQYIHFNGRKYAVRYDMLSVDGLYMLSAMPNRSLYSNSYSILLIGLLFISAMLILSMCGIRFLSNSITVPVRNMEDSMMRIRSGDMDHRLMEDGGAELAQISRGVNELLDELQKHTDIIMETQEQLYETELLRKESQLMMLQFQINPHFLYNTLECVRSICSSYHYEKVTTIISAMIGIFRYSTLPGSDATVREEIACCRNYAEIIRVRFAEKYSFEFHVDEEALDTPMLRMVLQPILENAISHGLERKPGRGSIRITCRKETDTVCFIIYDTGVGMSEHELAELRKWLDTPNTQRSENYGIGLKNVYKRLLYEYGSDYRLQISSTPGVCIEVTVHIPYRKEMRA